MRPRNVCGPARYAAPKCMRPRNVWGHPFSLIGQNQTLIATPTLPQHPLCNPNMPNRESTFPAEVIEKLEGALPEFRDGDKKSRKSVIKRLTQETLPQNKDRNQHKEVKFHSSCGPLKIVHCVQYSLGCETMVLQQWEKKGAEGQSALCEEMELEASGGGRERG